MNMMMTRASRACQGPSPVLFVLGETRSTFAGKLVRVSIHLGPPRESSCNQPLMALHKDSALCTYENLISALEYEPLQREPRGWGFTSKEQTLHMKTPFFPLLPSSGGTEWSSFQNTNIYADLLFFKYNRKIILTYVCIFALKWFYLD